MFEDFYLGKYDKARRLSWRHVLGHCVLRATLPKGKWELDVSVFQALILLLFNSYKEISYAKIQQETGLVGDDLVRAVQSLALAKRVRCLLLLLLFRTWSCRLTP